MAAAYEGWAKLELFGHRVIAGYLREVEQYGEKFCQIVTPDLPAVPADPANYQHALPAMPQHLQTYGGKAIYCMTPCSEEVARRIAERIRHEAIPPADTRPLQIEAASAANEYDDDGENSDGWPISTATVDDQDDDDQEVAAEMGIDPKEIEGTPV